MQSVCDDEKLLMARIDEAPDDASTWAVLSDFYEDRGDVVRARGIRLITGLEEAPKTKRIDKVSPDMEAMIPLWVDYWCRVGRCSRPANRSQAEASVGLLYQELGFGSPRFYIWLDSPLAGCYGAEILRSVGESASRDGLGSGFVSNQIGNQIGNQRFNCLFGQHDVSWLAFYHFFVKAGLLTEAASKLEGLLGISRSCGWWWPFENAVIMTERPTKITLDAQGRLSGKSAVVYPDGFSVDGI